MLCVIHRFGLYSLLHHFLRAVILVFKQSSELYAIRLGWMKPGAFNCMRKRVVFLSGCLLAVVCLGFVFCEEEVFVFSNFIEKLYSSAVVP